jgi:hypothetical protein
MATATEVSFKHARVVIECASQCKKPSDDDMMKVLGPIPGVIGEAQKVNNRSPLFNFEKAFEELIQCMNWLMAPNPKGICTTQLEAADMYLNKLLMAAKDKPDPDKTLWRDFVKLAKGMVTALGEYAGEFHKSGITWKVSGGDAKSFKPGQKAKAGEKKDTGFEGRLEAVCVSLEAFAAKKKGGRGCRGRLCDGVCSILQGFCATVHRFVQPNRWHQEDGCVDGKGLPPFRSAHQSYHCVLQALTGGSHDFHCANRSSDC